MPLPNRHTPRAKWHNYNGAEYFVTICTNGREHYFGEVRDGQTQLTAAGECLRTQIENVQNHYPYAATPLYVIMPNHTHLIVVIDGGKTSDNVGTRFIASVRCGREESRPYGWCNR